MKWLHKYVIEVLWNCYQTNLFIDVFKREKKIKKRILKLIEKKYFSPSMEIEAWWAMDEREKMCLKKKTNWFLRMEIFLLCN